MWLKSSALQLCDVVCNVDKNVQNIYLPLPISCEEGITISIIIIIHHRFFIIIMIIVWFEWNGMRMAEREDRETCCFLACCVAPRQKKNKKIQKP